jgi:hypothetical protein
MRKPMVKRMSGSARLAAGVGGAAGVALLVVACSRWTTIKTSTI